jgi:hypothetical protein
VAMIEVDEAFLEVQGLPAMSLGTRRRQTQACVMCM